MPRTRDDRLDPALRLLIGVILLGGIMGILDGSVVAVGIDTLATRFHTSLSTIGWVSTGYLLALTTAIPITTWAVDRFGSRKLWLFGLVLFLAASLACGLAWNVQTLIVFRVLQGLGAGILDPLVLTLLARAAGPRRAGRVMGLMGMVLSAGPVLGLIVGGIVLQGLTWRWMFLINLPIGIVAFLGALRVVPAEWVRCTRGRAAGGALRRRRRRRDAAVGTPVRPARRTEPGARRRGGDRARRARLHSDRSAHGRGVAGAGRAGGRPGTRLRRRTDDGVLYRTLPAPLVPQGSSVLYINQLGAAIGIAVVTLILTTAGDGDGMAGFHRVHWFVIGTVAVILAAGMLLPGRPEALADTGAETADICADTVARGAAR